MSNETFTILIVDDEEDMRETISMELEESEFSTKNGFKILTAGNGTEAFAVIKEQRVDLVITDIRMPKGDGIELLSNIKNYNPKVPVVIMITGYTDMSKGEILERGAFALIYKPFHCDELLKAISESRAQMAN